MRGIEDTAFTGVVSISTTLGRYFVKGDLSLTSIAGSGRRMVFSVEGGPTEVKCLVFMGSSFRRRRKDVCGGLQLRGATEWMNPEHLFSSGVVSVADRAPRTDQQPAPPSGPNPVGSHPVSRGGRAPFDRGDPLRAVRPKFLSASATCRISFERTVRAKGASLSRRRPMTRWRECSRTAAKALRRRLTEPGVMCYKSPGGC